MLMVTRKEKFLPNEEAKMVLAMVLFSFPTDTPLAL